jgi:hypothetical protein
MAMAGWLIGLHGGTHVPLMFYNSHRRIMEHSRQHDKSQTGKRGPAKAKWQVRHREDTTQDGARRGSLATWLAAGGWGWHGVRGGTMQVEVGPVVSSRVEAGLVSYHLDRSKMGCTVILQRS